MDVKKTEEKEKVLSSEYDIKLTRVMEPLLEIAAEKAAKKAATETKKIHWWKIFVI